MCFNPGVNTYFQSSNNGQYKTIGSSGEQIYISSNGGSGNVFIEASGLYLNGSPITPGGGGGGVTDIQAGTGISVNQTTGSVTITNTSALNYVFPTFDAGFISSGSSTNGGTQIFIPKGNYQITYTITFDSNVLQSQYSFYMIRAYCWLQSQYYGQVYPYMVQQVGVYPSQVMSYDPSYPNCITATDYIQIYNNDNYNLRVYQDNQNGNTSYSTYISAILVLQ